MESIQTNQTTSAPTTEELGAGIRNLDVTWARFEKLSGVLSGYPFIKVVVNRSTGDIHFIRNDRYAFHADYIAEQILHMPIAELELNLDAFNKEVYLSTDRRFYLGILALHKRDSGSFLTLETSEIDNMSAEMIQELYLRTLRRLKLGLPLLFKPANHIQEALVANIDPNDLPRTTNHELFASAAYVALNPGKTKGRIRIFKSEEEFKEKFRTIEWYDIIVMARVPDDIPRVAGIINSEQTTPLSHTNVLASGWNIPNAIQIGIIDELAEKNLNEKWVEYTVGPNAPKIELVEIQQPESTPVAPNWRQAFVEVEAPDTAAIPVTELATIRAGDRSKYGTKAANLGEMFYLLEHGSARILGFYRVKRPPRANLLPYLAQYLGLKEGADVEKAAWKFLRDTVKVPRGVVVPFSMQQEFLESSPKIQQTIGKLKMVLKLNARDEIENLAIELQTLIRTTKMSNDMKDRIDGMIAQTLGGVSNFVVRSSSNAEDLANFSAAGIYESFNHVTTAETIFQGIKDVWASLVTPRSIRLRHEVGIPLDVSYMGVVIQEEVQSRMGGVLVSTNPMNRGDFRNVYINVSCKSAQEVVSGEERPLQYLYNTMEGGGRTLSLGDAAKDLPEADKALLQKLAFAGRLLQSYFSPDYLFESPVDIEWAIEGSQIYLLQLRPYGK